MRLSNYSKTILIALLILCLLAGCGASSSKGASSEAPREEAVGDYTAVNTSDVLDKGLSENGDPASNKKLIKTFTLRLETKEYDNVKLALKNLGEKYHTEIIFEEESAWNGSQRSLDSTIKVPQQQAEAFVAELVAIEGVKTMNKSQNTEDVTASYRNQELRLKSLNEKLNRLWALKEAEDSLESLLTLEREITDTIFEIEGIEQNLKRIDEQVAMSSVQIHLTEITVNTAQPLAPVFGERLSNAFNGSIRLIVNLVQGLILLVIGFWPVILIIILVIFFIKKRKPFTRLKEKRAKKKE